jgi:hypothetical protein
MRNKPLVWSLLLAVAAVLGAGTAFAGENWIGTWKLNPAKSQLGSAGIRAQTLTFEATAAGIKLSAVGTDADGEPITTGYTSKLDGKDVPWPGNPVADTASPKRGRRRGRSRPSETPRSAPAQNAHPRPSAIRARSVSPSSSSVTA